MSPPVPGVSTENANAGFDREAFDTATPRPHRLTREQQDAAHTPRWSEPEIQTFVARVALFMRRGMSATDADDLAEGLVLRDRDGDDWRLCLECRHLSGRRCALASAGRLHGVDRRYEPLPTLPQRCEGFADVGVPP